MDKELQAFADAFAKLDFDTARELADAYVTSNQDKFTEFVNKVKDSADEAEAQARIVKMVEVTREAGMDETALRGEMFLLHRWHPNNVTGQFRPTVRNEIAEAHQPRARTAGVKKGN